MSEGVNITDAELEVMKVIWHNPGTTAKAVSDELNEKVRWSPSTIKTLLARLCSKGIIYFNKKGKEYYYFPLITEEQYTTAESKSFLDKMFHGSINLMLLNFIKNKKISIREIKELRSILDETKSEEE